MRLGLGPSGASPSIKTCPASAHWKPLRMSSSVDFPQPDGPTSATNSPLEAARSMPSSTGRSPFRVGNDLEMPVAEMLPGIAPAYLIKPIEAAQHVVEQKAYYTNDDHGGDDQVIAITSIAGIDNQVP